MSLRKRTWTASDGTEKQAWLVDYKDAQGKRRAKQFGRKKDAEAFVTKASWEISQGTHNRGLAKHHGREGRRQLDRQG